MKRCPRCVLIKPVTEFHINKAQKDGFYPYCKPCRKEMDRNRHGSVLRNGNRNVESRRKLMVEAMKDGCVDCGYKDFRVLEFDHRPGAQKIAGVAQLVRAGVSEEKIKQEIAKCDVRCRNCHTIKTYERLGNTWHIKYMEA